MYIALLTIFYHIELDEIVPALIKQAKGCVGVVLEDLKVGCSMDIVASGCRDFIDIVQDLLGEVTSDEILNNIFKGFCVGK